MARTKNGNGDLSFERKLWQTADKHGIVVIKNNHNVGANNYSPLQTPLHKRSCGTSKTIGAVVRGYKIGVTKWMRENTGIYPVWQRNYYERIIRNGNELNRIRGYILDNPLKWETGSKNPRVLGRPSKSFYLTADKA